MFQKLLHAFPAFTSRNYRLYFAGQLISLTGTWLQIVAEGWLIFQLTQSAFMVGVDAAAATVPTLFLSLFGGVIVDRYPKKLILIFTQAASMIFAFTLGFLTLFHVITVAEIIILAFLLGVVNAIDAPARQAYVTELIDRREHLASAIALNAGMFNAARVIGPSLAGILIAGIGTDMAFILNGASYIAVIIALFFITTPLTVSSQHLHPIQAIKAGLSYAYHHQLIRLLIILYGVVSIFGWSYSTILPVIAVRTLHLNASGLGYLYSAAGLGALLSTFLISAYSHKFNIVNAIIGGNLLFSAALIAFTFVTTSPWTFILLFLVGGGLVTQFSLTNTLIQHQVDDAMRGRVLSLFTLVFLGFTPFGNLEIGFVSEHLGTELAIRLSAIVVLIFGIFLFTQRRTIIAHARRDQNHQ